MSYQSRRRTLERPRRRNGCLGCTVVTIWLLLIGVLVFQFYIRPQISQQIGQQIGNNLSDANPQPGQQIQEGAAQALPTVVAGLPSGEIRITESEANQYIAANADSFKPIQSIIIHFVPDEIVADIQAFGTTSQAHMQVSVQNGRIVATNPRIDGPLGQFISLEDIVRPLEQQLNAQLAAQGRRITDVRVESGSLVMTVDA